MPDRLLISDANILIDMSCQVCLEENIDVHGTVWLVGEMVGTGGLSGEQARTAYQRMEQDGSRLPWDEVEKQLKKIQEK